VARSRSQGVNPHTVITGDISELREALQPAPTADAGLAGFCPTEPNIARMYSYWLSQKDHYATDRAAANKILEQFPEVAEVAVANRAFMSRAVQYLADQGITQFLDVGSGLPASPNVHETARTVTPGARVVYADRDPVVLAHARALLAVDDQVGVVAGDIRNPEHIFTEAAASGVIDTSLPTGVLLLSVLHFLTAAEADAAVAAFRERMAPGSYLAISAGTSTGTDPALIRLLQDVYGDAAPVTGRTEAEIAAWFGGLTLVEPGLVDVWAWRPDTWRRPATARARFLAGVGRAAPDRVAWSV
jgi:O-methyltransferase involved in polyketide biosynthesis